jgi:hypothetical protein
VSSSTAHAAAPLPVPGWLVSRRYDLTFFIGPCLLSALAAFVVPADGGTWAWLVFVVGIDVAHVWATLYRTWLDPAERRMRRPLLLGTLGGALLAASLVQAVAPAWFWTLLAWFAVFHFIRQQQGFAALYRVGRNVPALEARVEHWTVAALCAWPVLWWHAHLPRRFTWFTAQDFLPVPEWPVPFAGAVTLALVLAWAGLRVRGRPRPGGDLWVLTTGLTWFAGIVWTNGDLPFTIANVVAHGVPYFALVHHVSRRRWADTPPTWLVPMLFLAIPIGLALTEELLWDALVWQDHVFDFDVPAWLTRGAVAVLAAPQITHYLLDGFIWKMPPGSPLRTWMVPDQRRL